jgi:hypothetical protein
MGNDLTGENRFEAAGQTWTLKFTINSLIRLEEELGDDKGPMKVAEIAFRLGRPMSLGFLRTVFWVGLLIDHPDLTLEEAGDLLGQVEDDVASMLILAFGSAFPKPKEAAPGKARPRKRATKAGTGRSSTGSGAS